MLGLGSGVYGWCSQTCFWLYGPGLESGASGLLSCTRT